MKLENKTVLTVAVGAALYAATLALPTEAPAWCLFSCRQNPVTNQTFPVTTNSTTSGHSVNLPINGGGMRWSFNDQNRIDGGAKATVRRDNNAPLAVGHSIMSGSYNYNGIFVQMPAQSGDVHSANGGSTTGTASTSASSADPISTNIK